MNNDINQIIKLDDLHWNEDEQKYVSLSQEEITKILEATFIAGQSERKTSVAKKVVDWATLARVNHLILQGVLAGRIKVSAEKNKELQFAEVTLKEMEEINDLRKDDSEAE
jgi:hypothetical protein